jgi:hypothetical protein
MSGQGVAGAQPAPEPVSLPAHSAQTIKVEFGRGLGTLVSAPATEDAAPRKLLPPWFFFAADLLLLAFTAGICFDAVQPFDLVTLLFCVVSVSAGAILSIWGIFRSAEAPLEKPPGKN